MILIMSWSVLNLGPLGLDEDIYNTRDPCTDQCTSYATENTDYLTHIQESKKKELEVPYKDILGAK